ncbi:MAG TPA: alpha/beta hydrolase [Kofleriaceae bacterium]
MRIASPLAGTDVELHVREFGNPAGAPLLFLHGGWGYGFYPFDVQVAELGRDHRILIPDRTGYGRSTPVATFPARFHEAAATEAEHFLDALAIERCAIWGHSDGAVIAAILALRQRVRYSALILEALHLDRVKPRSRAFFTMMAEDPDAFGERVTSKLAADHGERWRDVLRAGGRVWLDIAATPNDDFFDHRLHELAVSTLVLHGTDDPRTEPNELDRIRRDVPSATIHMVAGGTHSPHSERAVSAETTRVAAEFLRTTR